MTIPEQNSVDIAIIGAGLTGLLTAHGLKKHGFHVTVYEQETSLTQRRRDWTIALHWALPIFKKLLPPSVVDNLPQAICNPYLDFNPDVECLPCMNANTGEMLFKSPMPGSRRVSRQRIRQLMTEGVDIRWGKRVSAIRSDNDTVQVEFDDGETVRADYVLGTDGAGSKVRDILYRNDEKARAVPSGYYFATAITRHNNAERVEPVHSLHPVTMVFMGTDSVGAIGTMYVDDPEDKSTWTTFWVKIWRKGLASFPDPPSSTRSGQEALAYLKKTTKNGLAPFQNQIDWAPEDGSTVAFIDEMKTWTPFLPFDTHEGRVTLAGDAAHPMLVYRGQGFQHAIVDASNYVDALLKIQAGGDREEIFNAYNAEMVERGAKAVEQSLKEAELSFDPESILKMTMVRRGHGKLE
ncbi:hypothetical protein QBC47DRAFT_462450 [Echria macrotheca]|uniref:FAD-binding domain-containing protein n=1 Tax=Echria macrotheca TaxID=438768 RepID=A0AAJ0BAX0_9PEZI|nr:hypothetical protein QBC47DRAFT_462450 [Echria macrotheca]